MINEYATLGKKSLCHHMTGWLDLFVPMSGWGCEVCGVSRPAYFPSPSVPPSGGSGASPLGFPVPQNPASKESAPSMDLGIRFQGKWSSTHLETMEYLANINHHPPLPTIQSITAPCTLTPWETALWRDMGLAQNSVFYLQCVLWSVQWGCFFLNKQANG